MHIPTTEKLMTTANTTIMNAINDIIMEIKETINKDKKHIVRKAVNAAAVVTVSTVIA